jgi:predicted ArsR family transcriptional regulator
MTVDELALALDLTRSAVRAHLSTLHHDGLVEQRGARRGLSKPARLYAASTNAQLLLSRAYAPILTQVLHVIAGRMSQSEFQSVMHEVGRGTLGGRSAPKGPLRDRVFAGSALLNELGGLTEVEEKDGNFVILGHGCPLAAATSRYSEACDAVESLLSEYIGSSVTKCCERYNRTRCCFQVPHDSAVAT